MQRTIFVMAFSLGLMSTSALADHRLVGDYEGACTTYYGNAQPGHCPVTLHVDQWNQVTVPADGPCLTPTSFFGTLRRESATLQSAGWQAQPRGQTLRLTFRQDARGWRADGSGYGLSDRRYQYNCSFRKVW